MTWAGKLANDGNWIDGCFEWYDTPYSSDGDNDPVGSSTNVYWNSRPGATTGAFGGHKICTIASANSCQPNGGAWCNVNC